MYATVDTYRIADAMAQLFYRSKRAERDARRLGLDTLANNHAAVAATCDSLAREVADAIRFTEPNFDRGDFVRTVRNYP